MEVHWSFPFDYIYANSTLFTGRLVRGVFYSQRHTVYTQRVVNSFLRNRIYCPGWLYSQVDESWQKDIWCWCGWVPSSAIPSLVRVEKYEADYGHCAYGFGRRLWFSYFRIYSVSNIDRRQRLVHQHLYRSLGAVYRASNFIYRCFGPGQAETLERYPRVSEIRYLYASWSYTRFNSPIPELQCTFRPRFPEAASLLHNLHDELVNGGSTIHSQWTDSVR